MGQFGQINPGDDVRRLIKNSAWINHVTNAADFVGSPPPATTTAGTLDSPRLSLDVLNDTGSAIDVPFPILRLTDPVILVSDNANVPFNEPQFKGATPDGETHSSFVIVQGPLASGAARPAVLIGLSWCKVDVGSESDTHATTIDGDDTPVRDRILSI